MTVNGDGKTVTVDQRPSGGRNPGSNTTIKAQPLAVPTAKAPKIRTAPGKTVAGTGRTKS